MGRGRLEGLGGTRGLGFVVERSWLQRLQERVLFYRSHGKSGQWWFSGTVSLVGAFNKNKSLGQQACPVAVQNVEKVVGSRGEPSKRGQGTDT